MIGGNGHNRTAACHEIMFVMSHRIGKETFGTMLNSGGEITHRVWSDRRINTASQPNKHLDP
jgi:hypothetical protein